MSYGRPKTTLKMCAGSDSNPRPPRRNTTAVGHDRGPGQACTESPVAVRSALSFGTDRTRPPNHFRAANTHLTQNRVFYNILGSRAQKSVPKFDIFKNRIFGGPAAAGPLWGPPGAGPGPGGGPKRPDHTIHFSDLRPESSPGRVMGGTKRGTGPGSNQRPRGSEHRPRHGTAHRGPLHSGPATGTPPLWMGADRTRPPNHFRAANTHLTQNRVFYNILGSRAQKSVRNGHDFEKPGVRGSNPGPNFRTR